MNEKYKIGMASKYSGVSPQTVRYYEKKNLLTSIQNDLGDTRHYNVRHFKWLTNIRRYFKCGFSEQEVWKLIHCKTLPEMASIIDQQTEKSRAELGELRSRIQALDALSYDIKKIDTLLGRVVPEENPPMTFLILREGDEMIQDAETERTLEKWLEEIHLTSLGSIIPMRILTEERCSSYRLSGHCVPTSELSKLHCTQNDPALRNYPPVQCIHTACKLENNGISPEILLPHVYEYLEDFQLRICGDAFGRALAVLDEGASVENTHPQATFYEYWIPVDKIQHQL